MGFLKRRRKIFLKKHKGEKDWSSEKNERTKERRERELRKRREFGDSETSVQPERGERRKGR